MNKIMILGAGVYQVPIIEKAKEMGLETVVVSPDGDYPGFDFADRTHKIDVRDEEAILAVAREEAIDGIITDQTDIAVRTVAFVAEKMGLSGIGYECARLFTDKNLMREKTTELGIPTIPYLMVSNLEQALAFFRTIGGTAIIKPVDNQGSRGVSLINSERELTEKFDEAKGYSGTGQIIIEKHIKGREFEVDSIVADYDEKTLMYADTDLYNLPDVFASCTRLYPSVADEKTLKKLLTLNHDIVTKFGLKQGLTHNEYIQDEDTGEIYLIEAAARGGGSFISSHIGQLQSGINTSEFLINLAMGKINKLPEFETGKCSCGYVTFYLPEGKVIGIDGIEDVKNMTFVRKHMLDEIYPGLVTKSFSDKSARNVIIVSADDREQLNGYIEKVRNTLKIEVKTDMGIKGPIWE